jgi:GTP-binding protein LepA
MENKNLIRNFAIIAHIDHGKSTLADRLLEMTGTITKEKIGEQFLDSNPIAREHGITIKLAPVRMDYTHNDQRYTLNLIDTPGHVDFSYEVIRTLNACEGAVLVIDATKGVQAQTIANFTHAHNLGLKIIPVINKVDLPTANIPRVLEQLQEAFGFSEDEVLQISAKTGLGVEKIIRAIIERIPPPTGDNTKPTQSFIFDSVYDIHRGIVIYVKMVNGQIHKGDEITFLSDNSTALVMDTGFMKPSFTSADALQAGEVGYIITNIKDISQAKVGDTITHQNNKGEALPGYRPLKPFVYLSIYPADTTDLANLRKALYSLKLNDASLEFSPDYSSILGTGFRCGFLGLLHAQITIERIEKEFNVDVYSAPPNISYMIDGKLITSPKEFDISQKEVLEPYVRAEIYTPEEYLGGFIDLIYSRHGEQKDTNYFGNQVKIVFEIPLSSIIYDFFDRLKSISSGYASFDYEFIEYRKSPLTRIDIAVNDVLVPEFSFIMHTDEAESFARKIVKTLSETIPKHMFVINVQARIGGRILASEKISALSKDVTAKLYGGDVTRKMKLREKQKEGKKKMKTIGRVTVPKEAFLSVLKV